MVFLFLKHLLHWYVFTIIREFDSLTMYYFNDDSEGSLTSSWTVVLIPRDGFKVDRIHTDENDLTRRISAVLDRYRGCSMVLPEVVDPWEAV